jgi:hypothetical protein
MRRSEIRDYPSHASSYRSFGSKNLWTRPTKSGSRRSRLAISRDITRINIEIEKTDLEFHKAKCRRNEWHARERIAAPNGATISSDISSAGNHSFLRQTFLRLSRAWPFDSLARANPLSNNSRRIYALLHTYGTGLCAPWKFNKSALPSPSPSPRQPFQLASSMVSGRLSVSSDAKMHARRKFQLGDKSRGGGGEERERDKSLANLSKNNSRYLRRARARVVLRPFFFLISLSLREGWPAVRR